MTDTNAAWEQNIADLWTTIDDHAADTFIDRVDALVAELPPDDASTAIGLFERGSARDSTGHPEPAVALYRAALAAGLSGQRRRRAIIQMASSLRNLGQSAEAARLLTAELDSDDDSDELDGAICAFLALALVDLGREREAVATSLSALARYLPRYNHSLSHYAWQLTAKKS